MIAYHVHGNSVHGALNFGPAAATPARPALMALLYMNVNVNINIESKGEQEHDIC